MQVELHLNPQFVISIFEPGLLVDQGDHLSNEAHLPDFSKVKYWLDGLWNDIQLAVRDVSANGKVAIDTWMTQLKGKIDEIRSELGQESEAVISEIQAELDRRNGQLRDALLAQVPTSIGVQTITATLSEVVIEYKVTAEAGLQASLLWTLEMSAGGGLSVSAKYLFR